MQIYNAHKVKQHAWIEGAGTHPIWPGGQMGV